MSVETKVGRFMLNMKDVACNDLLQALLAARLENKLDIKDGDLKELKRIVDMTMKDAFDKGSDALIREVRSETKPKSKTKTK